MDRIASGFANQEKSLYYLLFASIYRFLAALPQAFLLESSSKPNGILVTTERIVRIVRTNTIACGASASSAYAQQLKPMPEPDACGGIDYDTR